MMHITVNGNEHEIDDGATIAALVAGFNFDPLHVAVEVNEDLVTRKNYDSTILNEGDQVEIVTLVGGG